MSHAKWSSPGVSGAIRSIPEYIGHGGAPGRTRRRHFRTIEQREYALLAAALRLARERAGQGYDPTVAYGCVDWFRYDVTSPQPQADGTQSRAADRPDAGRDDALPGH